ncbi:M28 family metallopeptidase [Colwellia hornerae]|uniref:Zn-dependent exopeptidase M28 n=1 Tax=Colwellia hornerae TaxID=89402 RepID=A0A5C6QBX4_9GAMM|nr:M28 family metallopeptidase [Colwellia hornerae]TWX55194.1 Zn-dependent exopeptidase M28 [Colwellia hornerae]TWX61194.1 Zn-dependent exopeptidase M28 [Colwellia hornerae]TWX66456.1 Zn-dependent exopeptidase M28 [Colwellia hornerae]
MKYFHRSVLPCLLSSSLLLVTSCSLSNDKTKTDSNETAAYSYLKQLVSPTDGIGAREAGTEKEQQTASYIKAKFEKFGYRVTEQNFSYNSRKMIGESKNIIAEWGDATKPTIILGAHYDSTAMKTGSMGATDNGAGVAAMLAIAQALTTKMPNNYSIRFIAFGAEEIGLQGSNYYVNDLLTNNKLDKIAAMINFDTIAGGDKVYVHSAHSQPYDDCKSETYNSDTFMRNALLKASIQVLGEQNKYVIHPDYEGYPEGVTGSWSDHASFACAGIPIAYVESTNFSINGQNGYDGYSQSTAKKLWTCYDKKNSTACDKKSEKNWGNIWHTQFDRLDKLDEIFPGRVKQQLNNNVEVLIELLADPDKYLHGK